MDKIEEVWLVLSAILGTESQGKVFRLTPDWMKCVGCDGWMTIFNALGLKAEKKVDKDIGLQIYVYMD